VGIEVGLKRELQSESPVAILPTLPLTVTTIEEEKRGGGNGIEQINET
jgi:hypothetical protein